MAYRALREDIWQLRRSPRGRPRVNDAFQLNGFLEVSA